jgi:hypothetical protein
MTLRKGIFISQAAVLLSLFLPWQSVFGASRMGIAEPDGQIVGVAALLGAVAWYFLPRRRWLQVLPAALCSLTVFDMGGLGAAFGLSVAALGGLSYLVLVIVAMVKARQMRVAVEAVEAVEA